MYQVARLRLAFSGNSDRSGLLRMMELAMTAFHAHLRPAIILQRINQFLHFHLESLHAMPTCRPTTKGNGRSLLAGPLDHRLMRHAQGELPSQGKQARQDGN